MLSYLVIGDFQGPLNYHLSPKNILKEIWEFYDENESKRLGYLAIEEIVGIITFHLRILQKKSENSLMNLNKKRLGYLVIGDIVGIIAFILEYSKRNLRIQW